MLMLNNEVYTYSDYSVPDVPHQPLYLNLVLQYLRSDPSIKTVLDVGCGDGNFSNSIAEAGYKVYGIDLSEGGIRRAAERYPNCSFRIGSAYADYSTLFAEAKTFDAIISVEVIEHLYDPRQFTKRLLESVRAQGLVIVTTPYWGYLKNIGLAVTNRMDRALTALWDGGHIKHWSVKTLRALMAERGFDFVAFHGTGRKFPYLWKGMLMVFRAPSHGPK
jgi:2-polyprenyl-3-methyl-5-hydroxy-6-metoxy-1,4-benzoquinol methylase